MPDHTPPAGPAVLQRRLGLALLVLYGTGITIGAGIYVLIGAVAGRAGLYAPWSFVFAALVMALTVASYAELSTRFPVSAGEAAYVRAAFNSKSLSIATGLLTIVIGVVSSAAVALGSAGYIRQFVDLPQAALVVIVVGVLGAVAAWGILQSVVVASICTIIEVSGLIAIIAAAAGAELPLVLMPPLPFDQAVLSGIAFGSLLAFFAFVGFEDLANVVEEANDPHRDIPRAMVLTLIISTILYVAIALIAVSAVPTAQLAASPAPLALVFRELSSVSPATISLIAIFATLNTILAQITMAARVVYGMAKQGDLPAATGHVHPMTATPLVATVLVVAAVIILALFVPFERLAEGTSVATLAVFALVNLALLRLRHRQTPSPHPHVRVPLWVPAAGFIASVALIATSLLE